jgi:hypothetical protein
MKKILIALTFIFVKNDLSAQVIFGNSIGTAANKTSVLMEFPNTGNRGLILPYVTNKTAITTPGSIILDASTPTAAKVKYYNGTTWVDLSVQPADVSSYLTIQPLAKENAGAKVVIGSETSTADGILVLESATKAMVLPMATSYQNIVNPAPGTMVLLTDATIKILAVYNGTQWSFWNY